MPDDECLNPACKTSFKENDKVKDFAVMFVFDEDTENTEVEKIVCFMRALKDEMGHIQFTDETDLTPHLDKLLDQNVAIKHQHGS